MFSDGITLLRIGNAGPRASGHKGGTRAGIFMIDILCILIPIFQVSSMEGDPVRTGPKNHHLWTLGNIEITPNCILMI